MENTKQIEAQKKNKNTSSSSSSSSTSSSIAKRLWSIARVIYYMLRKATCKRSKLMLDLNLIMQRSKLAGKAITHLLTFNHNHHHHHRSMPCFYMDPMMSYYNPNPREVEFSCSNTPSNSKSYKHGKHHHNQLYDAEAIAKVFEILNDVEDDHGDQSLISSPSPLMMLGQVKQLRITDSPFPVREEESDGFRVDLEAEEFIRRFYEQLRLQPASTPEYFSSLRRSPLLARA